MCTIAVFISWPSAVKSALTYLHEALKATGLVDLGLHRRLFVRERAGETLDRHLVNDQLEAVKAEGSRQDEQSAC